MVLKVEVHAQSVSIWNGDAETRTTMAWAFQLISDKFIEDPTLKVQVVSVEPKIMVQRYIGKKISAIQINYLIKIIADRTERKAYIKILCNWLQHNSIRWEKIN